MSYLVTAHRWARGYELHINGVGVDAAEWAERMQQTHVQRQCPRCGRWTIWEPKSEEGSVTEDDLALVDAVARSIRDAYEELPDGTHPELTEVYEWRGEARAAIRAIREAGAAA